MSTAVGSVPTKRWAALAVLAAALSMPAALAQPASPPGGGAASAPLAPRSGASQPAGVAAGAASSAASARAPGRAATEDRLASDLISITAKLNTLEGSISKSAERSDSAAQRAFWLAVLTIVASIANQIWMARYQRSMAREKAGDEVSNSYAEWQLKQLSELYGPLRALLEQSNAMYRQMNLALATADPDTFRLERKPGGDFDDQVFEIHKGGEWVRFRTVRDLGAVYNKGYGVEPFFDDVVSVGARIAKLIEDKAGYARSDAKELIRVMGAYLAHYAVLSRLHKRAQAGADVEPTAGDQKATFPMDIQRLVNEGFDSINSEVMKWRAQAENKP